MKTKMVDPRSLRNGMDGQLKLSKYNQSADLVIGDVISVPNGIFRLERGTEECWNLAPVSRAGELPKNVNTGPITRENWNQRKDSLSTVDRLSTARRLGIV